MKRFISSLVLTTAMLLNFSGLASAMTTWQPTIHTLPSTMNTRSFGVEYSVLSVNADTFTAQLLQSTNGGAYTPCGATQNTGDDPNGVNGNSGTLPACVDSDGDYSFKVVISRDGSDGEDVQTVGPTSTHVDATAPGAPIYGGKTQSGNSYTLNFTAPNTADVVHVQIFASTSKTYTADSSTRVGDIAVNANQSRSFSYNAPDGATRYFSLQAFDAAGNGSTLVGDAGTIVTPVHFVTTAGGGNTATNGTAQALTGYGETTGGTTGQVQGVSTTTPNASTGHVNASGNGKTSGVNGKVLGIETAKNTNKKYWIGTGIVAVLLLAAYYWFVDRKPKKFNP